MGVGHVCLTCGACCAQYRVAFHWLETEGPDGVPVELTAPLDAHRLVMQGTKRQPVRCVALEGEIGSCVACSIYDRRPTPCRELEVSQEQGRPSEQCDRARLAWGLPPLRPDDFAPRAPFDLPAPAEDGPELPRAA
jgi:Fe-S-cluster containining protein